MKTRTEWDSAPAAERQVWLDGVLERWPLERLPDGGSAPRFVHSSGVGFVLVFAAQARVGLDAARYEAVETVAARVPTLFSPEVHVPLREVAVPAHLCATAPVTFEGSAWVLRDAVPRLRAWLDGWGWRLPSECEWEAQWALGPDAGLTFGTPGEVCLDDWHRSYEGAPTDASPWGTGAELVKAGSRSPDDVESAIPSRRPIRSVGLVQARPVIPLSSEWAR
jgi:hypothetical protein